MTTFTILEHHEKSEDGEDDDFGGDYFDLEILDENGVCIQAYGDAYHDSGQDKAQGFIDGIEWVTGEKVVIDHKDVADREY